MNFRPPKCFSLSVTTMQSFASAMAASIMSNALRGFPVRVPSAMIRPQMIAACSSKERIRPANTACGPFSPVNHCSSSRRLLPAGVVCTPRQISATLSDEMSKSPSACSLSQASSDADGAGLVGLERILVSSRYRLTGQSSGPPYMGGSTPDRRWASAARLPIHHLSFAGALL